MHLLLKGLLILIAVAMLTACATTPESNGPKVHCPACNTDFDAFYHKRF